MKNNRDTALDIGSAVEFGDIIDSRYRQIAKEFELDASLQDFWVDAPEDPDTRPVPEDMSGWMVKALGVPSLYSHQVESWNALRSGKSVVLQTPTASGKTYSFNPAIIQDCAINAKVTALYLFPLKALCQDQVETIDSINERLPLAIKTGVMTGDTPLREREATWNTTQCPQLVVWNPDVLNHFMYNSKKPEKWQKFREYLRNLKYVVVDEAHTYQGVFGSHFTNIRRRLELLVDHFGGDARKIQ
jgi:DEAD/DEAH box helicase domain-containing protein